MTSSTQTEQEPTFGTVSVTVSNRDMDRQPSSLVSSLASQVLHQQYSWDLTRFGPMPTDGGGKKVPTGPNGQEGTYWTWFVTRRLGTSAYGLGTYNGRPNDECTNTGEWANSSYLSSIWVHDVKKFIVFGDSSCSCDAKDGLNNGQHPDKDDLLGTITCTKWKDAKCYQGDPWGAQDCALDIFEFPMAYCNWK